MRTVSIQLSRAFVIAPNKNLDGRAHVAFYINRFMALLVVMKPAFQVHLIAIYSHMSHF